MQRAFLMNSKGVKAQINENKLLFAPHRQAKYPASCAAPAPAPDSCLLKREPSKETSENVTKKNPLPKFK